MMKIQILNHERRHSQRRSPPCWVGSRAVAFGDLPQGGSHSTNARGTRSISFCYHRRNAGHFVGSNLHQFDPPAVAASAPFYPLADGTALADISIVFRLALAYLRDATDADGSCWRGFGCVAGGLADLSHVPVHFFPQVYTGRAVSFSQFVGVAGRKYLFGGGFSAVADALRAAANFPIIAKP